MNRQQIAETIWAVLALEECGYNPDGTPKVKLEDLGPDHKVWIIANRLVNANNTQVFLKARQTGLNSTLAVMEVRYKINAFINWRELAARVMDALADAQERMIKDYPEQAAWYPSWEPPARWLRWHADMFRTGKPMGNGAGQPAVLQALAAEPLNMLPERQYRKKGCAGWFEGHADHSDGGGPYEERVVYVETKNAQ